MTDAVDANNCESKPAQVSEPAKPIKVIVIGGSGARSFGGFAKMLQHPKSVWNIVDFDNKGQS